MFLPLSSSPILREQFQQVSFFYLCVGVGMVVLGVEFRSYKLHLEPLNQPFFVKGFFKIGSRELFPQAGFEPQS
jgi:hypothetical protein